MEALLPAAGAAAGAAATPPKLKPPSATWKSSALGTLDKRVAISILKSPAHGHVGLSQVFRPAHPSVVVLLCRAREKTRSLENVVAALGELKESAVFLEESESASAINALADKVPRMLVGMGHAEG